MKRIFHTWDRWECYPAGFYENRPTENIEPDECERRYAELLRDCARFNVALERVIVEWRNSCEHYLTNERMNRIAWLGQAAMCIETGIPSCYRGGFNLLTQEEQRIADNLALMALNRWADRHGHKQMTMEQAASKTKADLY